MPKNSILLQIAKLVQFNRILDGDLIFKNKIFALKIYTHLKQLPN